MRVLIVGAGIAGLAAACHLTQAGHEVEIFERSAELTEIGAGLQVSANAVHALSAIGLGEALRAIGHTPGNWRMRLHRTGETVATIALGDGHEARHGAPYLSVHRADLQRALLRRTQELAPGALRLGAEALRYEEDAAGVTLHLAGGEARGDLLIGADGVRSAIRAQIVGPEQPVYTGSAAWRGLVPAAKAPEVCAEGIESYMGPGRHAVLYRIGADGRWLNFVAPVDQAEPSEESWTLRRPWADMKRDFEGWHPHVQAAMDAMDPDACFLWSLYIRKPLTSWRTRRAVLIGDAAHPTLPFIAQGAAMAIEDAAIIARALEDDLDAGLDRFEAARIPRATRIVEAAGRIAETFHMRGRDVRADLQTGGSAVAARDEWLYNYNPMTAPLT